MKIDICILNYVDTIDVLIDGIKIDIKKLSLFSKAEFECDIATGVHEITVIKNSNVLDNDWKKSVLFDWISCLFGVPSWTLTEKIIDTMKHSVFMKVKVEEDIHINLKLTEDGFELFDSLNAILNIDKQTEISRIAKKRIKKAYIVPGVILATVIEVCMLFVGVFLIVNSQFIVSVFVFALAIFWVWLFSNVLFKRK